MRSWTSLAILFWLGCAHAPAAPTEAAPAAEESPHGMKGASEPIPLPYHVIDLATGRTLTRDELTQRLAQARVIYVGEEHRSPHDHAVELDVLEMAHAALGMEMLPATLQPALDAFVGGASDETAFLSAVDWEHTWGYAFGLYRPLLDLCKKAHAHAFALNAPRGLAHAVAKNGTDGLSPDEKRALPEMVPGPPAHREMVREAFGQHPHGKFEAAQFERFYQAQLVWDETMAARVAEIAKNERLVVIAGEQHVRRFAIPQRAERRGVKDQLVILTAFPDDVDDAKREGACDLLWVYETG